jgi:hypothetical protein
VAPPKKITTDGTIKQREKPELKKSTKDVKKL